MRAYRQGARRLFYVLQPLVVACAPDAVMPRHEWEPMYEHGAGQAHHVALSPTGHVFIATSNGVFRAHPGEPQGWKSLGDPLSGGVTSAMLAPMATRLFVVGQACGVVHEWREQGGWRTHRLGTSAAGDLATDCPRVLDLAGNDSLIVAVGVNGLVAELRDDDEWTFATNAAKEALGATSIPPLFTSIAISGTTVAVTNGATIVARDATGQWRRLLGDSDVPLPNECVPAVVGYVSGSLVAGSGNCLIEQRTGGWNVREFPLPGFVGSIFGSAQQSDGSLLVWSLAGSVVRLSQGDPRAELFDAPFLDQLKAAASDGRYVWIAGNGLRGAFVGRASVSQRRRQ